MNKQYFGYLLRKNRQLCMFLLVCMVLICGTFSMGSNYHNNIDMKLQPGWFVLIVECYVCPVLLFHQVHSKKASDHLFSLPISRKELLITTMIFMYLMIILPFIATTVLLSLFYHCTINVLLYLLLTIVTVPFILMLNTGLYLLANSVFDGVVVLAAYTFLPVIILIVQVMFGEVLVYGWQMDINPAGYFHSSYLFGVTANNILSHHILDINAAEVLLPIGYGIIGIFLMKKHFINRKVERAESISREILAYPFIIHCYVFLLVLALCISYFGRGIARIDWAEWLLFTTVVYIAFCLGEFIYRRKIGITIRSTLYMIGCILISIMFTLCAYRTRGFGLSERWDNHPKTIEYNYSESITESSGEIYQQIEGLAGKSETCADGSFWIEFHLQIPENEMDDYRELIELIDQKRKENVDEYYSGKELTGGGLGIVENVREYDYLENNTAVRYREGDNYYYQGMIMSLDELKTISRYTQVGISYGTLEHDEYEFVTRTLSELLK